MKREASFTFNAMRDQKSPLRRGDIILFEYNHLISAAIFIDLNKSYILNENIYSREIVNLDPIINRGIICIVNTEYSYNGENYELMDLAESICDFFNIKELSIKMGEALILAVDYPNNIHLPNMNRGGKIKAIKIPEHLKTNGMDLEGLTIEQINTMKANVKDPKKINIMNQTIKLFEGCH